MCVCETCQRETALNLIDKDKFLVIRDLDIWGQPSFLVYQDRLHRCRHCGHRQSLIPSFKRRDVKYTYRFEELVLTSMIKSTAEDVAKQLGISAETVERIVKNRIADAKAKKIDPQRVIKNIGIDEISLRKGHKAYATILTDLTDPSRPAVLAVAKGRDEAAAKECLEVMSPEQRAAVATHSSDMGPAYLAACRTLLKSSQSVIDRFHVAKKLGEVTDALRKKNYRAYQRSLSRKERKHLRSLMHDFRRRPEDLKPEQKQELEVLFNRVPVLGQIYHQRWEVTAIFDTAKDRTTAEKQLRDWIATAQTTDLDWQPFITMLENHWDGILAYFDEGRSSGPVEGLNTKLRVITRRSYGIKSVSTLWTRVLLDVNWAAKKMGATIDDIRQLVGRIQAHFAGCYT
jgi:transposase